MAHKIRENKQEQFIKLIKTESKLRYTHFMKSEIEAQPENIEFLEGVMSSSFFEGIFERGFIEGIKFQRNNSFANNIVKKQEKDKWL